VQKEKRPLKRPFFRIIVVEIKIKLSNFQNLLHAHCVKYTGLRIGSSAPIPSEAEQSLIEGFGLNVPGGSGTFFLGFPGNLFAQFVKLFGIHHCGSFGRVVKKDIGFSQVGDILDLLRDLLKAGRIVA
jgi:hypothetical protein